MAAATSMGYCIKCKAQREIKAPKQITLKNGRPATKAPARSAAARSSSSAPSRRGGEAARDIRPLTSGAKQLVNLANASHSGIGLMTPASVANSLTEGGMPSRSTAHLTEVDALT